MTESPELVAARRLLSLLVAGRESLLATASAHLPLTRAMALREAADPTSAAMVLDHAALARQLDVQLVALRVASGRAVTLPSGADLSPAAPGEFSVRSPAAAPITPVPVAPDPVAPDAVTPAPAAAVTPAPVVGAPDTTVSAPLGAAAASPAAAPDATIAGPEEDTSEKFDPPTNVTPATSVPMRIAPSAVDPFRSSLPPLPGERGTAAAKAEPVKVEPPKAAPARVEPPKAPTPTAARVEPAKPAAPPKAAEPAKPAAPPKAAEPAKPAAPPIRPATPPPPAVSAPPRPAPAASKVGPPPVVAAPPVIAAPPRVPGPPPAIPGVPPAPPRGLPPRPVVENEDPYATTVFKASEIPVPTRPGEPPAGRRSEPARPGLPISGTGFQPIAENDFFDDDPSEVTSVLHASEIPPMLTRESAPPPGRRATTVVPVPSSGPAARASEESGFPTIADPSHLTGVTPRVPTVGGPRPAPTPVPAGMEAGALRDVARALGVEDGDGEILLDEMEEADLSGPEPESDEGVFSEDDDAVAVAHVATHAAEEYVIEGDDEPRDDAFGAASGAAPRAPRLTDDEDYGPTPPPPAAPPKSDPIVDAARVKQMLQDARTSANRGDLHGAIQHFSDALDMRPDVMEAWLGRGRCHLDLGDYSSAMSDFQRAEDLGPNNPQPHVAMGDLYYARKEYKRAIEFYDHAIEVDGSHAMARCLRGMSHYYRKNYKQALQDLERAFSLDPEIPNIRKYMQMASNKLKSS